MIYQNYFEDVSNTRFRNIENITPLLGFGKVFPKILLFPDNEPIILSKVANYSQLGTHCVQY